MADARKHDAATIDALEAQVAALRDDVASILATLGKVADSEIRGASDAAQDGLDGIGRRGRHAFAAAGRTMRSAAHDARSTVEHYPVSAGLIVVGLGLAAAWLLLFRSR